MTASPAYLAPTWRYAGDDWAGTNALVIPVFSVQPTSAPDGTQIPGVPLNVTGMQVTGTIAMRASGQVLPAPAGAIVGSPTAGIVSLSLSKAFTALPPQAFADWSNPDLSMLLVRYRITDLSGNLVTQGVQPLFVF